MLPGLRERVRGRDLAVAYAVVLVVVALAIALQPGHESNRLVLESSTNLDNLSDAPLLVLVVSAFVTSSLAGLWIVVPLVWAYAAAQRWLGRGATVLVAAFGHVFATLTVAVVLSAGIAHHELDRDLAREPDVGASYGLAAVLGVLTLRLPRKRRRVVVAAATLVGLAIAAISETFTDVGHLVAWGIGLGMGQVGLAVARRGQQ